MVTVPEAAVHKQDLEALKAILDVAPTHCNSLLIDNVESEEAGEYIILTFQVDSSTAVVVAETCFHLLTLTLAFAYATEPCCIERRVPFETSNNNNNNNNKTMCKSLLP